MIDATYKASIEFLADPETVRCVCDQCDWTGTADQLGPIGDAILTPGHASPAGRCPDKDCTALAYVDVLNGTFDRLHNKTREVWVNGILALEIQKAAFPHMRDGRTGQLLNLAPFGTYPDLPPESLL